VLTHQLLTSIVPEGDATDILRVEPRRLTSAERAERRSPVFHR
jgi:hypothetical protein